jgi:hypothetical protein
MRKKPTGYSSTTPVSAISDAVASESNGAGTTTSTYDHRGRRKTVDAPNTTAADGSLLANVTNTLYFPDGSVQETNGDQTYRTAYTYDYAGRMKTMATYRISGGIGVSHLILTLLLEGKRPGNCISPNARGRKGSVRAYVQKSVDSCGVGR